MNATIERQLSHLELGELQHFQNLAIVPLLVPGDHGPVYLTLAQAMAQGVLTITEVTEGGSVPDLKVINRADAPVLLLDGEELAGAKQNRALNTTILLRETSETIIPVSCTEHGRWSYASREFRDSDTVMPHKIRSTRQASVHESLRQSRAFRSDQGAVWDEIAEISTRAAASSPTGAMRDVFETRRSDLAAYLAAFACVPHQAGLLVFVNGKVVGFDSLSREGAYQALHRKLVQSYAMDALLEPGRRPSRPSIKKAQAFLKEAAACQGEPYPSVGYGTDYRFQGHRIAGSALVVEDTMIHAAFFRTEERIDEGRMSGYRRRRSFRS